MFVWETMHLQCFLDKPVSSLNINYHINVSTVNHCGQRGPLTVVPTFSADSTRCCLGENCRSRQNNGKWLMVPCIIYMYDFSLISDNSSITIPKAYFIIMVVALGVTVLIVIGCAIPCIACIYMLRQKRSNNERYRLVLLYC